MLRSVIKLLKVPLIQPTHSNLASLNSNKLGGFNSLAINSFHTTSKLQKVEDRKMMLNSMPKIDEGTEGEQHIDIDYSNIKADLFPDENTPNRLFNGVPFKEIPIVHIRVSHNNTIVGLTDHKGVLKIMHSCGREGFKNARKGTNIAAQATAITLSTKALEQGFKTVRVRVRGLGPGRMSSIKGLQMGGLNIISVTDSTRVTWTPLRARKARRL
ncbi:28S ribosomal protein S11, mitochondrial [Venturia canescens]|uniref:28S ribosomal protein S11, mitochondrial n=1 Tax=Venturia canescens TaxID=32260 RepID=UPI001C9C566C|nr:28S ribosomal protein S11, mitochondrial [Venturia canescens]